jgi:hypothetical protein
MHTAAECPACARWTLFAQDVRRPRRCVHCLALIDKKTNEPQKAGASEIAQRPRAVA